MRAGAARPMFSWTTGPAGVASASGIGGRFSGSTSATKPSLDGSHAKPRVSASFEARLEAAAGTFTFGPATNRVVRSGRPLRVLRGRTADWLVVTWDTIAEETP